MTTDRRTFLSRSAKLGLVLAADGVVNACGERPTDASRYTLSNEKLRVVFDRQGLLLMEDTAVGTTFHFKTDRFRLEFNKQPIESAALRAANVKADGSELTYTFPTPLYNIEVAYELRPGWRFVSKQILVHGVKEGSFSVDEVEPLQFELVQGIAELYVHNSHHPRIAHYWEVGYSLSDHDPGLEESGMKSFAAFLRMEGMQGLFTLLQNPFFECTRQGQVWSLQYSPEMEWQTKWGPFPCDRACLGPYRLTGRKIPKKPIPEWQIAKSVLDGQDEAEVDAVTECVRAFLMIHPQKAVRMHCGWYENDYEIDISKPDGREEYKRIIDVTSAVGCEHLVFAPQNTGISERNQSVDTWRDEYVLWLTLGQKIRKREWRAGRDPVPDSIQEMLDYARSKNVRLMAYVYPDLPFSQSKEWLTPDGKHASLGYRSLQDWLIETLVSFHRKTGIAGYFFDYVYLSFPGTSRYSQWFGWRRVQETLRSTVPEIVISGGAYDGFYGPWEHLAGNWPWPMCGDEQPESHPDFKDLHFARAEANHMRYMTFLYKNYQYYPTEALPGFISHQEPRNAELKAGWRTRNFDYLGWKYSAISSIGYAGINHVIAFLPARDIDEFKYFSAADKAWLRNWLAWTDANISTLRHTRLILGEPALGRADGSAAIVGDRGYIFLFNPNGRKVEARFNLDASIGLERQGRFTLREMYPLEGRLWGKPGAGVWRGGDEVRMTLGGTSATVLSLAPAGEEFAQPVLFNAPGRALLSGGHLALREVRGEVGAEAPIGVLVANGAGVEMVTVNGVKVKFEREGDMVTVRVRFEGERFSQSQQVGSYDPQFAGGIFRGEFRIPTRIKRQLAARKEAWPIPWTDEDLRCTWLAPERLLLFVQTVNPDATMPVRLKINGEEMALQRGYASIRPNPRCFTGYYADVLSLQADQTHTVELSLPPMEAGGFQGLFFDNVETEYTDQVAS
jgi:hypothetical protein